MGQVRTGFSTPPLVSDGEYYESLSQKINFPYSLNTCSKTPYTSVPFIRHIYIYYTKKGLLLYGSISIGNHGGSDLNMP